MFIIDYFRSLKAFVLDRGCEFSSVFFWMRLLTMFSTAPYAVKLLWTKLLLWSSPRSSSAPATPFRRVSVRTQQIPAIGRKTAFVRVGQQRPVCVLTGLINVYRRPYPAVLTSDLSRLDSFCRVTSWSGGTVNRWRFVCWEQMSCRSVSHLLFNIDLLALKFTDFIHKSRWHQSMRSITRHSASGDQRARPRDKDLRPFHKTYRFKAALDSLCVTVQNDSVISQKRSCQRDVHMLLKWFSYLVFWTCFLVQISEDS